MKTEMFVFAPMFAMMAVVTVGWTVTEVARMRSRGLRFQSRQPMALDTPRHLTVAEAPAQVAQVASNDELGQRKAA